MSDVRSNPTIASLATTLAAIAAAQPEQTASTPTLLGVQSACSATLAIAIALQASLANSSLSTDVPTYLWVTSVIYELQAYLATLGAFTGAALAVTIVSNGGDCFSIAAAQYGDWTRYSDILQANGLADPFIVGSPTITIPQN